MSDFFNDDPEEPQRPVPIRHQTRRPRPLVLTIIVMAVLLIGFSLFSLAWAGCLAAAASPPGPGRISAPHRGNAGAGWAFSPPAGRRAWPGPRRDRGPVPAPPGWPGDGR